MNDSQEFDRLNEPLRKVVSFLNFVIFFHNLILNIILNVFFALKYLGWPEFDQVINVVLQTEMIVGAIIAFLLDNTVPGD